MDSATGLVVAVSTTPAHVHDIKRFKELVKKADPAIGTSIYGDKGYKSKEMSNWLNKSQLRDRIMHKGARNKPLSSANKAHNGLIRRRRHFL